MSNSLINVLRNAFNIQGRAGRPDYWWWALIVAIIGISLSVIDKIIFGTAFTEFVGPLFSVFFVAALIPSATLSIRRLHDTGRSGWWLIALILFPVVFITLGMFEIIFLPVAIMLTLAADAITFGILFKWLSQKSHEGENQYGPEPAGS